MGLLKDNKKEFAKASPQKSAESANRGNENAGEGEEEDSDRMEISREEKEEEHDENTQSSPPIVAMDEDEDAPRSLPPMASPQPKRPTEGSSESPPKAPNVTPTGAPEPRPPPTPIGKSDSGLYNTPHPLSAPTLHSTLHYQSDVHVAGSQKFDTRLVLESSEARVFAAKISSNIDPKARLYGDLVSVDGDDYSTAKRAIGKSVGAKYLDNIKAAMPEVGDLVPDDGEDSVGIEGVGKGKGKEWGGVLGKKETGRYGAGSRRRGRGAV